MRVINFCIIIIIIIIIIRSVRNLGHPSKFQWVSRLGFVTAATSLTGDQTLHDVWPSHGLVHCIHFWGLLTPGGICARYKIKLASKSCLLLYWQRCCTALQQWASAKLRRRTRNEITELLQRAPPIFGWAAITLSIGPFLAHILVSPCFCHVARLMDFTGSRRSILKWQGASCV